MAQMGTTWRESWSVSRTWPDAARTGHRPRRIPRSRRAAASAPAGGWPAAACGETNEEGLLRDAVEQVEQGLVDLGGLLHRDEVGGEQFEVGRTGNPGGRRPHVVRRGEDVEPA